jgi:hypothetical protein
MRSAISRRSPTWHDPKRECHCRFCEDVTGKDAVLDDSDRTVLANVREFGWHLVLIPDEPQTAGWVFSVGMWHTLGSPELAMFGLEPNDAAQAINALGDRIKGGVRIGAGVVVDDVLEDGRLLTFRAIDDSWYRPMFGYATWFARRPPLPIAQVVWADTNGLFPWDAGVDLDYTYRQPSLWVPTDKHPQGRWSGTLIPGPWPYMDPPDTAAFTTKRVAFEGHPVLYVAHDSDGSWQFVDEAPADEGDVVLVHLAHVAGANPGVIDTSDLPLGWEATRDSTISPWTRQPIPNET